MSPPSAIGGTSRREASCAPPLEGRGPVSSTVIGERGGTPACTTYARPPKPGVGDVCAVLPPGAADKATTAARVKQRAARQVFPCATDATPLFFARRSRAAVGN